MGCFTSSVQPNPEASSSESSTSESRNSMSTSISVQWKVVLNTKEARVKYEKDGTLEHGCPESYVELRQMLDEHFSRTALAKYATKEKRSPPLSFWFDIQEYKNIFTEGFRYTTALDIYHTFVKETGPFYLDCITDEMRNSIHEDLEFMANDTSLLTPEFFDVSQNHAFMCIHDNIFKPFTLTEAYQKLNARLDKTYNRVQVDDFEYLHKLGEGGFGYVCHCVKKSTGAHYAMKIQRKLDLIKSAGKNPDNVCLEKTAFAACQHPFIINLAYAFQTDRLAIMVLGLSLAGDLQQALNKSPACKFDEDHARFYVAEVILAIEYLHQLGYIYRDLKPNNILLGEDGHILLLDLGGCAATKLSATSASRKGEALVGTVESVNENKGSSGNGNQFENSEHPYSSSTREGTASSSYIGNKSGGESSFSSFAKEPREYEVFGTLIYMAPEMIIMMNQKSRSKMGYTKSVDWWSLGVTLFKMVSGYRPFVDENFSQFVDMTTDLQKNVLLHENNPNYVKLFQQITFPEGVSEDCRDLIKKLLNVDERKRLGAGRNGPKNLKAHPWFRDIDWVLLELKRCKAPPIPANKYLPSIYEETVEGKLDDYPAMNFEEFIEKNRSEDWMDCEVPGVLQTYFQDWDFTSDTCMRVESGLTKIRQQYESNVKVRQIIGESKEMKSLKVPKHGNKKEGAVSGASKVH